MSGPAGLRRFVSDLPAGPSPGAPAEGPGVGREVHVHDPVIARAIEGDRKLTRALAILRESCDMNRLASERIVGM